MAVKHLQEIYKKKGKDFIASLFDEPVVITEQIDFTSFSFKRESQGFTFWKKNATRPIDKIDRTLMVYYEPAIKYIESLPQDIIEQIPFEYRFDCGYMLNPESNTITYNRLPENHLILTAIQIYDQNKDNWSITEDANELTKWAEILHIEKPPVIFDGILNAGQKLEILDFLNTPYDELVDKFKTTSFVKYVINLLNPNLETSSLQGSLEQPIEGILFRFPDKGVVSKLVDPVIAVLNKEKQDSRKEPVLQSNDIYNITLADLTAFMYSINYNSLLPLSGLDTEDKYLDFIGKAFKKFIRIEGDRYLDLDFREPSHLKKDEFSLNKSMIEDPEVLAIIEQHPSYESLFKIMINAFRKKKSDKCITDIFNKHILKQFNDTVDKISLFISGGIRESEFVTFVDYKQQNKKYVVDEDDENTELFPKEEPNSFIKDIYKDSKEDKKLQKEKRKESKLTMVNDFFIGDVFHELDLDVRGETEISFFEGCFEPFHNGHLETCRKFKEEYEYPVILGVKTRYFDKGLQKMCMDLLVQDNIIDGYYFIESDDLVNCILKGL